MGFFKFLGCVVAGAAAVAAAPVVLGAAATTGIVGAAAAAGSAVATGAAAAGSAVAAGAAAAGSAVAAGAAAAGSAVAGTAVGGAVISAGSAAAGVATAGMATVGGAVGSAAGAVGLTSVAAATGTTAGAAAVGTITTSVALGTQQAMSAKDKIDEANRIYSDTKCRYEAAESIFKKKEDKVNTNIKSLADVKARIAKKLIEMNEAIEKIENPSRLKEIKVSAEERITNTSVNFDGHAIPAEEWAKGLASSYAGGNILGVALTSGITSTITTAGTGAAMSSLSGAAATNATMAALGGGTVASGGLGMAGGAIMAKGLVFAPAFAIGGFMLNSKADDALEKVYDFDRKVDKDIADFQKVGTYYEQLSTLVLAMKRNILTTENIYTTLSYRFYSLVKREANADNWSDEEWNLAFAALNLAKVLETQCVAVFEKASEKEYDVDGLVSLQEVYALDYKNDPIKFNGVGTTELIAQAL